MGLACLIPLGTLSALRVHTWPHSFLYLVCSTAQVLLDCWGTERAFHLKHIGRGILPAISYVSTKWNKRMKFPILSYDPSSSGHTSECMSLRYGCRGSSTCPDMPVLLTPEESPILMGGGRITLQPLCQLSTKCPRNSQYTKESRIFFSVNQ